MAQNVPSDDQIDNFTSFTGGASREVAVTFIRGANGNVDQAINDYFDNPAKYLNQNRYDESAWSQDREGDYSNSNIPAFQIDLAANDQYPHSNAPTRPPSRVSQNSSTKGIPGSPLLEELDTWPVQESGVIGGSGAQFGPANQDKYYESSSWAMTHVGASSATEAFSDPSPAKRKRRPSQPAFIKPLGNGDYLPSLLTILHSIAAGRYALGLDGESVGEYKLDPEWWHGDNGGTSRVISLDNDEEPVDHGKEFLEETQKLMAFLDHTTRSYGSAGTLAQNKVLEGYSFGGQAKTYCDRFLLAWETHAMRLLPNLLTPMCLFKSQAVSVSPGARPQVNPFCTLVVTLSNGKSGEPSTLYDELDETIWSGDLDGKSEIDQAISQHAPILCVRVEQPDSQASNLNFKVPVTWYADRYLHENAVYAKQMRRDTTQQRLSLQQIEESKRQFTTFTTQAGKNMDIQEMLKIARAAHDAPTPLTLDDDEEDEIDMAAAAKKYDLPLPTARPDIVERLQAITKNVEEKLERLDQQKERIKAAIQHGRSLLKEPTGDPNQPQPRARYNLCGFATDACTTYILRRAKEQLIEMSEEEPEQDQWWRLHYPSGDDPKIEKERIAADAVPDLASSSSRDVLLVYAIDHALEEYDVTWPEPLQHFIKQDNDNFAADIASAEAASLAQLPGAADEDIPDLVPWVDDPDDPPAYADGMETGFVPDDGKLSDQAYAEQSMLERTRQARAANKVTRTETAPTNASDGFLSGEQEHRDPSATADAGKSFAKPDATATARTDDRVMDEVNLSQADGVRVQHLERAGSEGT